MRLLHRKLKMKNRLNITIDESLLERARRYAAKKNSSLSQLIEICFKSITRTSHRKTVIDLLKELPKPKGNFENYSKDSYYEEQKHKYGF